MKILLVDMRYIAVNNHLCLGLQYRNQHTHKHIGPICA